MASPSRAYSDNIVKRSSLFSFRLSDGLDDLLSTLLRFYFDAFWKFIFLLQGIEEASLILGKNVTIDYQVT